MRRTRLHTMVAEELVDGGFVVREAGNGNQASTLIAQDPAAFTLLATDVHMHRRTPSTC